MKLTVTLFMQLKVIVVTIDDQPRLVFVDGQQIEVGD